MDASEVKKRFVLRRIDGVYVNLRYEPVKSLSKAARFMDVEEYERFITGYYKPSDPSLYKLQAIRITYQEDDE